MKIISAVLTVSALILGLATTSVAQGQMQHQMDPASMQKMMQDMTIPASADTVSTKDYKAAHMKMMMGMHVPYSGNADVDFVRNMIPHHQGAIDMAKVELQHGKNPQLKTMAAKIIRDQEKEIAQMQAWLKKNEK